MKLIQPITITDSVLVSSNVPEADFPVYNAGTTFNLNDQVIVTTGSHKIYKSLVPSNVGNPVTDNTKWAFVSATNRWKLHDQYANTQTTNAVSIVNSYQMVGRCNSVALANVDANTIIVKVTDPLAGGVVYNNTRNLTSYSGITDWYGYFFEPIKRDTGATFLDLPITSNATIDITISAPSGAAKVGVLLLGNFKDLGSTEVGAKVGIDSFSTKTVDAFGNISVVPRAFRKKGEFTFLLPNSYIDELHLTLTGYRDTPIYYIGDDNIEATKIYGFYKDFSITIPYPTYSMCSLYVEGLT